MMVSNNNHFLKSSIYFVGYNICDSSNFLSGMPGSWDVDSESMTSKERENFWESLQEEWEKMAKEDDLVEHPWLTDFTSTTFQPYKV